MPPEQKREYLFTYLADVIVLAQAAEQQKLDDRDDVKRRLTFDRNKVLMETMLQDAGKAAVTDEAMHKVYDEAAKQMQQPSRKCMPATSWSPTEDEAKAIDRRLKKGDDFAKLAKEKSKDPGAAEGGDLGYFTKEQMVPEFSEVAFKLDKGQISDPVKTQFGWHIIKVEDKRTKPTPTFDEVKGQVQNYVAHRAQADFVDKPRKRRQYRAARPAAAGAEPARSILPRRPRSKPTKCRPQRSYVMPGLAPGVIAPYMAG